MFAWLSDIINDRLDHLYAAKAYLQSDVVTANSDATREVMSEIAEEEFDTQRLKHVHANSEEGHPGRLRANAVVGNSGKVI